MISVKDLQYICVHGLCGWGSYDEAYKKRPYWGMSGGDLMVWLRDKGFDSYAASVAPTGSAWDRACELYAQLAGTKVDYGEAHSKKYGHQRYGRDFSGCPLIPSFDDETRLVLLGHSFGGTTIRMFSELMAHGDEDEKLTSEGQDISPFFMGGMENRIFSIVTLASPMNGTTAYDLSNDPDFDVSGVIVPWWSRIMARLMSVRTRAETDGRDLRDYAGYDMHLDNARAMNERIGTLPEVYYFSVPCSYTRKQPDGTHRPEKGMEPLFVMRSCLIGAYSGKTKGGMTVDETWRENDGLVNTISAMAPSGAPSKPLERDDIKPSIWNVFPVLNGDHMYVQGGLMRKHEIKDLYLDMLTMIRELKQGR